MRSRWRRVLFGLAIGAVVIVGGVRLGPRAEGDGAPPDDAGRWSEGRVRVEVLNVGEVAGMAREATRALRAGGFDVVDFRNARRFDPERSSQVIDRVGRTDLARAVAERLGIDNVQSDPNPNLYVDVTVVLGREWTRPGVGSAGEEAGGEMRWWDPRGWFGG